MPLEPAKPSPAADALPCWQVRWDSGRKSGAVSMNEGPSWRRNIWQSCLLKQTRDDHKLVLEVYSEIQDVGQSNLAREDVGKGEGGRNTNRKGGGKHSATSKLCHLVGRQRSVTYQKLLCESITTALPYCPFWLSDRGVAPCEAAWRRQKANRSFIYCYWKR